MKDAQVNELLYQALETELGGVKVYQTAIRCTVNDDLRTEWQGYLEETENHVRIVNDIFSQLDLDPATRDHGSRHRQGQGTGPHRGHGDRPRGREHAKRPTCRRRMCRRR